MPTQNETRKAYSVLQAIYGIDVGDIVRVLRVPRDQECGWHWQHLIPGREDLIGKEGVVTSVTDTPNLGITVHGFDFPFFCLELVEKAPKATYLPPLDVSFSEDGLTVGGTFLSKDTIRRNLNL